MSGPRASYVSDSTHLSQEEKAAVTELLCYHDSYLREFEATISKADFESGENRIELDKTAFYPGGGGQPSDVGWLIAGDNRFKVVKVKRERKAFRLSSLGNFNQTQVHTHCQFMLEVQFSNGADMM
jgi:Ser-tRNA(Ala) deacylase AlaX